MIRVLTRVRNNSFKPLVMYSQKKSICNKREAKKQTIATTHDQIIYTSTETNILPSLQASGNVAFVFVQITFAKLSILPLASNSSTCKLASNILVMKLRKSMAVNESSG
jgi:hypothetical protein